MIAVTKVLHDRRRPSYFKLSRARDPGLGAVPPVSATYTTTVITCVISKPRKSKLPRRASRMVPRTDVDCRLAVPRFAAKLQLIGERSQTSLQSNDASALQSQVDRGAGRLRLGNR